jgi:hypothetical protein
VTATIYYDNVNEIASLTNVFTSTATGLAADPTTVSCVVTDPSGTVTIHTYQGVAPADITKPLVGKYNLTVSCTTATAGIDGLWSYVWIGTGAVSDVQPGTWRVLPSALGNWYIGLEEFKDRLGITDAADDSQAQIAIQSVTNWINIYTGRHFYRVTETRTFQPDDIWRLPIDDVVTITAVNVDMDGDGIFEQSWTQNTDYQLLVGDHDYNPGSVGYARPYGLLQTIQTGKWLPFTWPYTHLDRVQIVATWGWPAVPPAVSQAAFILAADLFKMKDAPWGVAGVSDYGVVRIQSNPWLVEMLRGFIRGRKKVGI